MPLEKSANPNTVRNLAALALGGAAGTLAGRKALRLGLKKMYPYLQERLARKDDLTDDESDRLKELFGKKNLEVKLSKNPLVMAYVPATQGGTDFDKLLKGTTHAVPGREKIYGDKHNYAFGHELGHASGPIGIDNPKFYDEDEKRPLKFLLSRKLPKALHYNAYAFGSIANTKGVNGAIAAARLLHRMHTGRENAALMGLDYLGRALTLAQLAEEGQATTRALKNIHELQGDAGAKEALKTLGPAYGSYALSALSNHLAAPAAAGLIYKALAKK